MMTDRPAVQRMDVLAFLSKIVQQNTRHFQEDFQYDRDILQRAAQEPCAEDHVFYWMSRPCGTWCVKERDVFLRESEAHTIWTYHEAEADKIKAYRVNVTGAEAGKVLGVVYPLNYKAQVQRVKQFALPAVTAQITFASGQTLTLPYEEWTGHQIRITDQYGSIERVRYEPESEAELTRILIQEHRLQSGRRRTHKAPEHPER